MEITDYLLDKSISFHIGLCFNFRNKIRSEKQQNRINGGRISRTGRAGDEASDRTSDGRIYPNFI